MADFYTTPAFLSNLQTSKVHLVCGKKWDFTRFVFTASRYLPLIGALLTVSAALQTDRSGSCIPFNDASDANPGGCIFAGNQTNAIQYAFLVVFEIVLLFLTALKRYKFYEHARDSIVITTLFRDNVLYMGAIISISLANIIVIVTVLVNFDACREYVLASRILFNLRETQNYTRSYRIRIPRG
ncbi:hypothetical protein SERLADRAFT_374720 [Serpula lacrymans var. lacrymans S7.9]|uniref:Uncharacterized protein n=1 Tax=Serpula lacrymans var. lacrymans (strain S7.9) TaxID=578457 RepID=F8PCN3_SERL9|nr:uncharacterized protein SERLADRAFT_374720 [Serpula lacrymans var. lacrymans S7.9]EGO18982.1 hypothetical protein SERLADRAFT_374720 [Serpula lacrymans var. lacrymans S7.9]